MSPRENDDDLSARQRGSFVTTHWSVVQAAGDDGVPGTERALEKLCSAYWYPLYAHIRRHGHGAEEAEDLTQEFFAWLLESRHLRVADRERGKFRSFLLIRLKHFLSDERKKARAQKRGGGHALIPLDAEAAEDRFQLEPATDQSPDKLFDTGWALTILERTVQRLRSEYEKAGRSELFDHIRTFQLADEPDASYAEISDALGLSISAIKSAIFRLRQRHADLLREEIAQTVAAPSEIDEEIRYLVSILA
jgi:DNA-directed RNA polymerase specialized sigma24 family protein